jgi:ProP effector
LAALPLVEYGPRFSEGAAMGFEQLAALRSQLAEQARKAKQTKESKGSRQESRQGSAHESRQDSGQDSRQTRPDRKDRQDRPNRSPRPNKTGPQAAKAGGQAGARAAAQPRTHAPRAEADTAASKHVDPVVHIIGRLQKKYPLAFPKSPAPKVALKVGIIKDLVAHGAELRLTERELRDAISVWCRGSRYRACLIEGAARIDLLGATVGQVSAAEAAHARRSTGRQKPAASGAAAQPAEAAETAKAAETAEATASAQAEAKPASDETNETASADAQAEAKPASGDIETPHA